MVAKSFIMSSLSSTPNRARGVWLIFLRIIVQERFLSWGSPIEGWIKDPPPPRNIVYVLHSFIQQLLENEPSSSSEESDHNNRMKWKWPKKKKMCHFRTPPLASGRRQKAKQKALAGRAPAAPAGSIWAQIPGVQLKNSSQAPGRELAKLLQQIFRKVLPLLSFCCHFPSSSTLRLVSLFGYQPRSLTLEVADKRFHMKTARQN